MKILTAILNRATSGQFEMPADGWYHLAPMGSYPVALDVDPKTGLNAFGTKHRIATQLIDNRACKAMAAAKGEAELLIDFDHESHAQDKRTTAAGWIQALENREAGLWHQPRWSDEGEAAIRGGRYRFISPCWHPADCEIVTNTADMLVIRPLRLSDAGLTNNPNLRGLRPLSNRAERNTETGGKPTDNTMLKPETIAAILAAIGLPPEATDEQVTAALPGVVANANCKKDMEALQNRATALSERLADSDLDAHNVTDANARAAMKPMLIANREGGIAVLKLMKPVQETKSITNRATAKTPGTEADTEKAAERKGALIANRARELQKTAGLNVLASYQAAQEEIEEAEKAAK